jgi:hypothetical protein
MKYILFELKLIGRSRRLKQMMIPLIFFIPQVYLMTNLNYVWPFFIVRIFFLCGLMVLPGATYCQFVFSTEASFIEKLIISPFPIYSILKAKYRLYCFFAFVMLAILLPSVLSGVKLEEIVSAFLFVIGLLYFVCFQCARFNIKSYDIKATKYYNWQGATSNQQVIGLVALFVPLGIVFLINQLFGENITLLMMSIIGIVFILTSKFWLMSISRDFEKNKYYRLACFREN